MSPPFVPLAAIRQPAFLWDSDGRVAAANDLAEALAGRPLAGCTAAEIIAIFGNRGPDGTPFIPETLPPSIALAGAEAIDVPMIVTAADGADRRLLVTASPIREAGAVAGALVVWQDVSGTARADDALRESEARFRAAFEQSPLGMGLGDPDGRILDSNAVLEELLGYGKDELEGKSFAEFTHPDDLARELRLLERVLTGDADRYEIEKRYLRRDGPPVLVRLAAALFRDGAGAPAGWIAVHDDVTERRRTEAALVASNAELERQRRLLDTVLGALPYRVSVWDRDERLVWANERFAAGCDRSREDLVGRSWEELGEATVAIAPLVRDCLATVLSGTPVSREVEVPTPTGTAWREVTVLPFGEDALLVITGEITARREAEAALRERDLRLNLALDIAAVGVFDWDPRTGAETWDERIRQQWGLPSGASVDHAVFEAGIHPDDRAAVAAANCLALDPAGDGRYAAQYRVAGRDGVERRISSRGQAFFAEGRAVRMIGTTIDVTEQERAEEAVRTHERLLQSIYRAAPAGIGLVTGLDRERRFAQVNDHLLEMTGYARDELIGQNTRMLYPDDEAHAAVGEESAFQLGICGRGEVETRWRRKNGTVIEILLSSSLIDPANPGSGVIFTALDVTDLRETEKALMRYARDLRRSNEELQRFAYVASHDLQEPLRSIISFSQLLERRYKGRLDSDADEYIDFIVEGGTRMQRLIQDLLQVSRVETRGREPVRTDPGAVVYVAARALDEAIRGAGAAVTVGELPTVMADPAQLEQVFANLISNAIKYRRPEVPPEVRISAREVDGMVEFVVQDNGIGIEAEYFDRIFEMFQRLHTHDEFEGTGIGLAVVKRIVERHGGTIRVESVPGEGTTFFFTLPAA